MKAYDSIAMAPSLRERAGTTSRIRSKIVKANDTLLTLRIDRRLDTIHPEL